jgi:hypothetical protein
MKQARALDVLSKIMVWDNDRSQREFAWLRVMSDFKYDGYRDYLAGVRFIECLADWLQQFEANERESAYRFVRSSLVFFSAAEIQHLVELAYPEYVERRLLAAVASSRSMAPYRVWSNPDAIKHFLQLRRRCLFFGLSDGARIDAFRRSNSGLVSNEQVVLATEINEGKWKRLVADLRKDQADPACRFAFVFLLDDFVGTGKTLLRNENGTWKGRLHRFWEAIERSIDDVLEPSAVIHVHHYIATRQAAVDICKRHEEMLAERLENRQRWFHEVEFSFGMVLPQSVCVTQASQPQFWPLTQKYYDASIEDKHTEVGGGDVKLGFGGAALPLILEHNTPNNSVALLWAETDGTKGVPMRPLFHRRQRHSG